MMMHNSEVCVPTSAVSAAGEGEGNDQVAPDVGDSVEVTLGGKVSRVEGGNVYFTPDTANGEPIKAAGDPDAASEDTEGSMDAMMKKEEENQEGMGY
jgi:hypothetical protein